MNALDARAKADAKNEELDLIAHNHLLSYMDEVIYPAIEKLAEDGEYKYTMRIPLGLKFPLANFFRELRKQGYHFTHDPKTGVLTIAW